MNLVKPLDLFDEFDEFSHIVPDLQPLFLQPARAEASRLSTPPTRQNIGPFTCKQQHQKVHPILKLN